MTFWISKFLGLLVLVLAIPIFLYEEPHLSSLFGAEYSAYSAKVNRWLPFKG